MKKLLLMICLLAIYTVKAQDVRVDWVHGLNASERYWEEQRNLFEAERRINGNASSNGDAVFGFATTNPVGTIRAYPTNEGVEPFATRVQASINTGVPGIGIGHSMGGLAVREVSLRNPNAFRGMVLCGAPLRGAKVMNSIRNGQAGSFLANAIWQISRGPLAQLGTGGVVVYAVAGVTIPQLGAELQARFLGDYGEQTEIDLSEESPYLNRVNSFQGAQVPHVLLWGDENSPVQFRGWSSDRSYVNVGPLTPWRPGDDEHYVRIFNTLADTYAAAGVINLAAAISNAIYFNFGATAYFGWVSYQWFAGKNYIKFDCESQYADIIGANRTSITRTATQLSDVCASTSPYKPATQLCVERIWGPYAGQSISEALGRQLYAQYNACVSQCYQPVTRTYDTPVQAGSDGTVPAFSALAQVTPWEVPTADQYRVEGCNHMEMRGHPNMFVQMRLVFERTAGDPHRIDRR